MHSLRAFAGLLALSLLGLQGPPARAQVLENSPSDAEYLRYGPNGRFNPNRNGTPSYSGGYGLRGLTSSAYFGEFEWAPPTAETNAWAARALQAGGGWSVARTDARAVVFTQPPSAPDEFGKVTQRFRVEYPAPIRQGRRSFRSASAELSVDCATLALKGKVTAYEDQNLSGRTLSLSTQGTSSNPFIIEAPPAMAVLAFTPPSLARRQCALGLSHVATPYGPEWRAVIADREAVRLVSGDEDVELLGKLYLKFRIETRGGPQKDVAGDWRSASIDAVLDCHTMNAELYPIGYTAPNLQGDRVLFPSMQGSLSPQPQPAGPTAAPSREKPVGTTLIELLGGGGIIFDQCRDALARAEVAVETPGTSIRREAEAWVARSLTFTSWSLPIWRPEQVLAMSDTINKLPNGNRVVEVRSDYFRPMPAGDGGTVAGRRFAVEIDCGRRLMRIVAVWEYGLANQQKEVGYKKNLSAPWAPFDFDVRLAERYATACR